MVSIPHEDPDLPTSLQSPNIPFKYKNSRRPNVVSSVTEYTLKSITIVGSLIWFQGYSSSPEGPSPQNSKVSGPKIHHVSGFWV